MMFQYAVEALDVSNVRPLGPLNLATPLIMAICAGVVLAIALIVATVLLSRKRAVTPDAASPVEEKEEKDVWIERIGNIAADYDASTITREEAFARLATVARRFASSYSEEHVDSYTLVDLNRKQPRHDAQNWISLRQTIAALYPPEFADGKHHPIAQDVSVSQACEWVRNLIERWR